jgi:aminoglycoside 6'-N-acetyltransferase I
MLVDLATQPPDIQEQAALLLVEGFEEPRGWPTIAAGREEVQNVLTQGFARALLESDTLLGWIGGLPEYHGRVWELHPLVVRHDQRRRGLGRRLVQAFEAEVRARGAFTVTLGTDDDSGMTSLADTNLYDDVPRHIAGLREGSRFSFIASSDTS